MVLLIQASSPDVPNVSCEECSCRLCCYTIAIEQSSTYTRMCYQVILEHEVLTTVPAEGEMKGVLFSLHGCLQLTTEWGYPSEGCPVCHGECACLLHGVIALAPVGSHP